MAKDDDFIGRKRGKLTVVRKVEGNIDKAKSLWEIYCECGNLKTIKRASFFNIRSCGCIQGPQRKPVDTSKAGVIRPPASLITNKKTRKATPYSEFTSDQLVAYRTWLSLHERCNKKKSHLHPDYGGRGISVSKEWDNFFTFWKDMGPRPSNDYSIERNRVNDNYCRENCRWLLKKLQGRNTRQTIRVIYEGEVYTLIDFLEQTSTLFIRKDFTCVIEERKKNGKQPVDITEHVKYLCKAIHSEPPKLKPLDFN